MNICVCVKQVPDSWAEKRLTDGDKTLAESGAIIEYLVETYGGGRYLELKQTPTGLYDLDFNTAYHPYCVYNASFVCPLPPRENWLAVRIDAGGTTPSPVPGNRTSASSAGARRRQPRRRTR